MPNLKDVEMPCHCPNLHENETFHSEWLKCHVTELSGRIELGIQNDQVFNKHQRGNLLSLGIFQHFNTGIVKGKIYTFLLPNTKHPCISLKVVA